MGEVLVFSGENRLVSEIYKHQEFQFPLLDAAHCGTESEHQVLNDSHIELSLCDWASEQMWSHSAFLRSCFTDLQASL